MSNYVDVDGYYSIEYGNANNVGTGFKIHLLLSESDNTIAETYTAVIYGDIDGDGKYDGADAFIASLIANGNLTQDKVSPAVWEAADCNHDGEINASDVLLLEQAGLLLAGIDQTKTPQELKTDETYQEYINLIDQSPEILPEETPEETPEDEPEQASAIVIFIQKLFTWLRSLFEEVIKIFA